MAKALKGWTPREFTRPITTNYKSILEGAKVAGRYKPLPVVSWSKDVGKTGLAKAGTVPAYQR